MDVVGGVAELLDVVIEAEVMQFVSAGSDEVKRSASGIGRNTPATSIQTAMPPPRSAAQVYQPDLGVIRTTGSASGSAPGMVPITLSAGASTRPPSLIMVISEPTASSSGPASIGATWSTGTSIGSSGPLGVAHDGMAVRVAHDHDDPVGAVLAGQFERGVDAGRHALLVVG